MNAKHIELLNELAKLVEFRDSYQARVDARDNFPLEFDKKVIVVEGTGDQVDYDATELAEAFYNYTRLAASTKIKMIEKRIDYLKTKLSKELV